MVKDWFVSTLALLACCVGVGLALATFLGVVWMLSEMLCG